MVVPLGPGKFYGSSLPRPRIYTDIKFNDERVDPPSSVTDPLMAWAEEAHWSMGGLSFKRLRLQGRIEGNVIKLRAQREKFLKNRSGISANLIADLGSDSDDDVDNKDSSPSPPPAPMATKRRRRLTAMIEEEDDHEDVDLSLKNLEGGENVAGGDEVGVWKRRRLARKLWDDFDRVATKSGLGKSKGSPVKSLSNGSEMVALRTRSRRTEESDGGDEVVKVVEDVKKTNLKGKKLKRVGEKEKAKSVAESGSSTPGKTRTSPRLAMR
ncbi:hypothetical protein ACSBR1_028026 [Camellia fascicularis]